MKRSATEKKIDNKIAQIKEGLDDDDAVLIFEQLLAKAKIFFISQPYSKKEKELAPGVYVLHGHVGDMVYLPTNLHEEGCLDLGFYKIHEDQFATFEENKLYCRGTETLLELLTRYRSIKTEKAKILAAPNPNMWVQDKGVCREENIAGLGNSRNARVMIECENFTLLFGFNEKVKA